jgi:hypothetical protein
VLATSWDITNPFDGWGGWLTVILILLVIGVVLWLIFKVLKPLIILAAVAALVLILGIAMNGLVGDGEGNHSAAPSPTSTTETGVSPASPPPSTSQPPSDGSAGIEDSDGQKTVLPLVDQHGNEVTPVDTTGDQRSPSSYPDALRGGPVSNWNDLAARMGNMQWYVAGVNARKGKTGFDWSDVQKWAKDGADIDARIIQVYNISTAQLSDKAVRDRVRGLIGDAADKLPIVHHNCVVNTRGLGSGQLQDFVDCRQMVRVTLAPLVYKDGKPAAMRIESGIFVDCFNVWRLPRQVVKHGPAPTSTTKPSPKPTVKPTPTPKPSTLSPKKLSDHPAKQGNAPATTWDPAPAPTASASSPGGYSTPTSTSSPTPVRTTSPPPPSPTVTSTYACTDPNDPTCG